MKATKLRLLGIEKLSSFRKSFIDLVHLIIQEQSQKEEEPEKIDEKDVNENIEIIEGDATCNVQV